MPTSEPGFAALADCRDAEDYFALLGVEYDERVLDSSRLHILKRFAQELADLGSDPPTTDLVRYRTALERAYASLLEAGPLQQRVFKVLRDRAPGQFVPESELVIDPAEPPDPSCPISDVSGGERA